MSDDQRTSRPVNWTLWIMLAVLAWGFYLAVGAILAGGNLPSLRGLIIFGCTLAFLGLWGLALMLRSRRQAAMKADEEQPSG